MGTLGVVIEGWLEPPTPDDGGGATLNCGAAAAPVWRGVVVVGSWRGVTAAARQARSEGRACRGAHQRPDAAGEH